MTNWKKARCLLALPMFLGSTLLLVAAPVTTRAAEINLSGRLQLDFEAFSGGFNPSTEDTAVDIFERSLRLGGTGELDDNWNFAFEFDFAGNAVNLKDAYVKYSGLSELTGIDNLSLTLGKSDPAFGLQAQIEGTDTVALERSPAVNAFKPGDLIGLTLSGYGNNFTYAGGIYEGSTNADNTINATLAFRGTYTPINESARLFHVGMSYAHYESLGLPDARQGQLGNAPYIGSSYLSASISNSSLVQTVSPQSSADILGIELAMVTDSLYLQGEYFYGNYDLDGYSNHSRDEAHALYVQVGMFLTGEMRSYDHQTGLFDSVSPNSERGALEAYLQYSYLDLGSDLARDYTIDTITSGLNWYANKRTRIGAAFVINVADNSQTDYVGRAFKARLQVVF